MTRSKNASGKQRKNRLKFFKVVQELFRPEALYRVYQSGTQQLIRANGEKIQLPGLATIDVNAGDKIVIATPGGGGWGKQVNSFFLLCYKTFFIPPSSIC
ncbi:MAG: hydantoinase B/oxoprolinase family protein [Cyclobacteriaceae bacterium]|nr:hydantoinase B/oxoprolinase family protein [Cyclobacteriaceae bacterium]